MDTTWVVGVDYTNFDSAVVAAHGVRIAPDAVLTIEVPAGSWSTAGVDWTHPDGSQIVVQGVGIGSTELACFGPQTEPCFRVAGPTQLHLREMEVTGWIGPDVAVEATRGASVVISGDGLAESVRFEDFDQAVLLLSGASLVADEAALDVRAGNSISLPGGVAAVWGSHASIPAAQFTGVDAPIEARHGSTVDAHDSIITDAVFAVRASDSSSIDADGVVATAASSNSFGVYATGSSRVRAFNASIDGFDVGLGAAFASSASAGNLTVTGGRWGGFSEQNSAVSLVNSTIDSPSTAAYAVTTNSFMNRAGNSLVGVSSIYDTRNCMELSTTDGVCID